jgi:hypothetical protein
MRTAPIEAVSVHMITRTQITDIYLRDRIPL